MSIKQLSVFFPCFNEEGSISQTVEKAAKVLQDKKIDYEILIIDDGSTDKTGEAAEGLAKKNSKIRVIHHEKNLGYGEALKSGFYNAKYELIVYTDGDGQFDFSEVDKFLEKINEYDLLLGYRLKRQDPLFRILFKKGWKLSLLLSFGLTFKDVDCGFKMIKRAVLAKIPHLESTRGAMINAEIAIKAKRSGFKVGQVGVNHYPRLAGKPTGASLRVIVKSYLDLFRLWWKLKQQKGLFIILLAILLLSAFLRFYKLSEYMTFLGDEGRDALIIKKILVDYDLPLIGPPTSVGNIYLGPFYYYMMAVSMLFFWLNPVAAAGMVALIGVLTVLLIYYLGKLWFGRVAGLISAYLYAISPVNIIYSKSSWNPNPTPFFSLLSILGLYKSHCSGDYRWLILTGAAGAAAIQMHYLALILLPILAISWIKEFLGRKDQARFFWRGTVLALLAFFLIMSPLVIFDFKHNFLNYRAITTLFFSQDTVVKLNLLDTVNRIIPIYNHSLIGRYLTAENQILTFLVSVLILIPILWNRLRNFGFRILTTWLCIGILGLTMIKQEIYDHYLGFLNPTAFLLFGSLAAVKISGNLKKVFWISLLILILLLTFVNLQRNPLRFPPNNQLQRTQEVAKFVINETGGEEFNFALLAKNNYDAAYQFYLDQYGHKSKQVPFDITEQLFVVCEDEICNPINNPKYEIAGFGWAKIAVEQNFYGVRIFKLVHNPSGKP